MDGLMVSDNASCEMLSASARSSMTTWMMTWTAIVLGSILLMWASGRWFSKSKRLHLPPGPKGWPIIGSILQLAAEPRAHRSFANLAAKYGPIFHLKLGIFNAIVISDVRTVEELYKGRDLEFSSRPGTTIMRNACKYIGFGSNDIAMQPYNAHCRLLRKICMTDLLTSARVQASSQIRKEEIGRMVEDVVTISGKGEDLEVITLFLNLTTNILCRLLFGKRFYGSDLAIDREIQNFRILGRDMVELMATMNIADLIPALDWIDPQGLKPAYKSVHARLEKTFGYIIEEHRQQRKEENAVDKKGKDFLDVLLDFEGENKEKLSENALMGVLNDLLAGGSDTSAFTMEWMLAELVSNPHLLERLQREIDSVVGAHRAVTEADVSHMPFLDAVLKETFRLHPPLPLLLPHMNESQCTLAGYDIPADTTLFVNMWVIHKDPSVWENPLVFDPDRFMTGPASKMSPRGTSYELLPFGAGRRICVGLNLALLTVTTATASLLHAFDWSKVDAEKLINFDEIFGVALRMRDTLAVHVKPRETARHYSSAA